jgi:excisionase family DNA binding protein
MIMTIATLPPPREGISAELSRATGVAATDERRARLIGPDGTTIPLPAEVYIALCDVIRAMSRGNAVTIGVVESSITTQKAADLLCVSRPTLIKLLDAGEIPFTRPGRHRRIRLHDLLAYRDRRRESRLEGLASIVAVSEEMGLYDQEPKMIRRSAGDEG